MSTKIYNAFRFKKNLTIEQVLLWAAPYRKRGQERTNEYAITQCMLNYFQKHDAVTLDIVPKNMFKNATQKNNFIEGMHTKTSIVMSFYELVRQYQKMGPYDGAFRLFTKQDLLPSIVVFQGTIQGETITAFMSFANMFDTQFNSKRCFTKGLKHFGYWNNSDKPNRVTNKQWKMREQYWDKVCPDAPSECGLIIQFSNLTSLSISIQDIDNRIANTFKIKDRINNAAKKYIEFHSQQYYPDQLKAALKKGGVSEYIDFERSKSYRDILQEVKIKVAQKIKPIEFTI